jgi:hypothetical protein
LALRLGLSTALLLHSRLLSSLSRFSSLIGFPLGSGSAFVRKFLVADFPNGYHSRILGHLGSLTGVCLRFFAVRASAQEALGVLEMDHGFVKRIGGKKATPRVAEPLAHT